MICLGMDTDQKREKMRSYLQCHDIEKVFVLSPKKFFFGHGFENAEVIEWADIIEYQYFYRLLQEIDQRTLVVVNECLRTQNRYDLTYNCIRHFLNQSHHQLIFQYLPFINDIQDLMILFDFDTRSRWKRERFDVDLLEHCKLEVNPINIKINPIFLGTDDLIKKHYEKEKKRLIDNIGIKDPNTIPRNLHLIPGKTKLDAVDSYIQYIGRNNRFKIEKMHTYKEDSYHDPPYTLFEFSHNFIDLADVISLSGQSELNALVTDLKVDQWYLERYQQWSQRINEGYASLSQRENRT